MPPNTKMETFGYHSFRLCFSQRCLIRLSIYAKFCLYFFVETNIYKAKLATTVSLVATAMQCDYETML